MPSFGYAVTYPHDAADVAETLAAAARKAYDDLGIAKTGAVWGGFKRDRQLDTKKPMKPIRRRRIGLQVVSESRPGDAIIMPEYDRAFRNFKDFLANCNRWIAGNVRVVILDIGLDTGTEVGRGALAVLGKALTANVMRSQRDAAAGRGRVSLQIGMGRPILGIDVKGQRNYRAFVVNRDLYELGMKVGEWVRKKWTYNDISQHLFDIKMFRPVDPHRKMKVGNNLRSVVAWEPSSLKILVANIQKIDQAVLDGTVRLPVGWKPSSGPLSEMPDAPAAALPVSRWMKARQIGAKLRQLRKGKGLTQMGLAVLADLKQSQISEMETATHMPFTKTLAAVARVLGVTLQEFLVKTPEELAEPAPQDPCTPEHACTESGCPGVEYGSADRCN